MGWVYSRKIEIYDPAIDAWDIVWMGLDVGFQSILSFNGDIYSAGGAIEGGDNMISGIYKLEF
jgi:hypothetical protein